MPVGGNDALIRLAYDDASGWKSPRRFTNGERETRVSPLATIRSAKNEVNSSRPGVSKKKRVLFSSM